MAGHRYQFHPADPQAENFQRLRQYDAAVGSDQKSQLAQEKFDFQQQKTAFDQAYKTSEAERKASEFETRAGIRGEQVGVLQERLKLQQERQQNEAMLKEQAQIAKDRATIAKQKAGIEFYKGIGELDPQSHDFRAKYGELMQKVGANLVNGDGKVPEDIEKAGQYLWQQHNTWASMNMKQQPGQNATTSMQDALAASQPVYGVADEKGQNFNATQAGKDAQTHVQTTYLPPGSKKPITEVFPRSVFDSMVAASVARRQGSPAVPVAAASPAAPTPPAGVTSPIPPAPSADAAIAALNAAQAQQQPTTQAAPQQAQAPIRMKFQDGKLVPAE